MSILEKMKKAHPAYWVLGLGGVALAIDYYVEKDRSVASSAYRKFFGSKGQRNDGGSGRGVLSLDGAAVMPSSIYRTTQVYYPTISPAHPHRHWMLREPFFGHGYGSFGHHGHEGRFGRHEYGAFGRNHVR